MDHKKNVTTVFTYINIFNSLNSLELLDHNEVDELAMFLYQHFIIYAIVAS